MLRVALALACILFAGCAAPAPLPVTATAETVVLPPVIEPFALGACQSSTVFFLEEYPVSLPWLPAGFQPRDLSGFVHYTPVIAGMVPAFQAVVACNEGPDGRPMATGVMGFYVQPPRVDVLVQQDEPPAAHDFYVVQYTSDGLGWASLLAMPGWNITSSPAEVVVTVDERTRVRQDTLDEPIRPGDPLLPLAVYPPNDIHAAVAAGSIGGGNAWFTFQVAAAYPQAFEEPPLLRFWHDGPDGLGFLEFQLPQQTVPAGQPRCTVTPGSPLHMMIGRSSASPPEACGPLDSFGLAFAPHDLEGRLVHLPGVRAG